MGSIVASGGVHSYRYNMTAKIKKNAHADVTCETVAGCMSTKKIRFGNMDSHQHPLKIQLSLLSRGDRF